jgi:hypothetical protein
MGELLDVKDVIFSVNRALWEEVSAAVRRITVTWNVTDIFLCFYFDGEISESDRNSMSCVGAVVAADFPEHGVQETGTRVDAPAHIAHAPGWWTVYARKEDFS